MKTKTVFQLSIKELWSLWRDPAMLILIVYVFTLNIYTAATAVPETLHNAPIAFVDHDQSQLSRRVIDGFVPPYFLTPEIIEHHQVNEALDTGLFTFVVTKCVLGISNIMYWMKSGILSLGVVPPDNS